MRWLQNPKTQFEAQEDFNRTFCSSDDEQTHTILNEWCQKWLSDKGWQRLQGNVRQKTYAMGSWEKGKEKMRTIQIPTSTHRKLAGFAEQRNMTINQAIKCLLELDTANDD